MTLVIYAFLFVVAQKATQPPLIVAINKGDLSAARQALHTGADPNTREIVTSKPSIRENEQGGKQSPGSTALDLAVRRESVPLVKLLLGAKADPNIRCETGWTSLMSACQRRNVEVVKLLLKYGAKPNLMNENGDMAIIFAANMDSLDIVQELNKAGADLKGGTGCGTLHIAIESGAVKTVRFLLNHKVDPNYHSLGCPMPLEVARSTYGGNEAIEKMLLKAGAKGKPQSQIDADEKAFEGKLAEERRAETKREAAKDAEFAKLMPEDAMVIEAALTNILDDKTKDYGPTRNEGTRIVLLAKVSGRVSEYIDDQMNSELDEKKANEIDFSMRKDFARRNHQEISIEDTKFGDSRILLVNPGLVFGENQQRDAYTYLRSKSAKCYVSTYLPGYSTDGTKAFLRFGFGPTPHGAAGTMLLKKLNGKWSVEWRDFAYYA